MKFVFAIARILMAAAFLLAGTNHVHNFLPQPPPPPGLAGEFTTVMMTSGFLAFVGVCEIIPALLLLANRFVPLSLVVLAPIIVNIVAINALVMPAAVPIGVFMVALWCLTAWPVRSAFFPLLSQKVSS